MRTSTSMAALALAFLHTTTAMNTAMQRKFNLLADMGLNPDVTPMDSPSTDFENPTIDVASIKSLEIATTSDDISTTAAETIVPEYVELPLDNFAKEKNQAYSYEGTFFNRFWVAQSAYTPGGPVFIYDVGEANAEPNALFRLQNETSFFKQLVDSYGGIGIVWEHRFYGNSTPEPIDVNTPPEAFRFLNTEQSLADVDRFAKQFSRKNINYTLTPDKTPWVFVGGSYPAMRAAFMRDKYPDTIYASYASSAPVQASVDQSFYFEPIWRGLNKYNFGNCSRDIQAATRYMDKIMDTDRAGAAKLKVQFLGLGAANNSHATFADALTTIFATWQSYGVEGGQMGLRRFCDWIETDPDTQKLAPAEGWAKSKGANFTVGRWASYPWFTNNVNTYLETNCSGKENIAGNCDLNRKFTDPAMISWTWQYCTQWGYFQSANLGPNQLVSKHNSLLHQHDICHRQFPTAPRSLFPDWPAVDRTNALFGGWTIRPSNTYWSNGEFDPWRTLSPASAEPFAPRVRTFTNPPRCGDEQSRWELFGYVIPDAQHCYDFRTTFAGGEVSRTYFKTALSRWLKCFQPRGGKPGTGKPWSG
ncbi:Nn.00g011310.m01.CDS01 [Neocucurbitaria sp. VM-36]